MTFIETVQSLPLNHKRSLIQTIKQMIREDKLAAKAADFERKQNSAALRAQKKAERIAKLEAKLEALRNPVGAKAIKANRKPSKVTVTTA